jgi:cyclic pyranopterin phosphate synthase
MACIYCRPSLRDGYLPAEDRLEVRAWVTLVRGLVAQGVRRVRITGGEPLLFKGLVEVVARLRDLGVEDLALTTNASRLEHLAAPLRAAGLNRINVSIDSLDPQTFAGITRGGRLWDVLRGVDAAVACGFQELKSNTVVLRGLNDHEPEAVVRWAWARGITPRFIEVMGVGEGGRIWKDRLVPAAEVRLRLAHLLSSAHGAQDPDRGPARYVPARERAGARVGFITGSTDTYCEGCDRLRATSDGVLRPCLSTNDGVSVAEDLRDGAGPEVVGERLREAWALKPDGRWKGCTEHTARAVNMRATGG